MLCLNLVSTFPMLASRNGQRIDYLCLKYRRRQAKMFPYMLEKQLSCSFSSNDLLAWNKNHHLAETIHNHKQSYPDLVLDNLPRKSIEMLSQGRLGTGNDKYKSNFQMEGFDVLHRTQPRVYRETSRCIFGQKTYSRRFNDFLSTPKCLATLDL